MGAEGQLLPLAASEDRRLVGGKASGLARLLGGGLPVPAGFVVTTAAWREARAGGSPGLQGAAGDRGLRVSAGLAEAVVAAWRALGAPPVAVRSSATSEDAAAGAMAGQFTTTVGVEDASALIAAIEDCWHSFSAVALARPGNDDDGDANDDADEDDAMAVIVQQVVPADVAGVAFTADPASGDEGVIVLEGSWGLGEAVVAGHVQPDRLRVDRQSGAILERATADKTHWIPPGGELTEVAAARRRRPCLDDEQVAEICRLAAAAAELAGRPQDVEWAWHDGRAFLLQSRDITTLPAARARETARLTLATTLTAGGRGPWVAHNLGETLRQPTPFTWSVMQRFMSAEGALGTLYRRVGYAPASRSEDGGFLELIGGRIYADLDRLPDMFFADHPYAYDAELVRRDPGAADLPPTVPRGSLIALRRTGRRLQRVTANLRRLARVHDRRLGERLVPAWREWCASEAAIDLSAVPDDGWYEVWQRREHRVHDELAPESLLPSLIVGMALAELRELLDEHCWREDRRELLNLLATAAEPDLTLQATAGLHRLAAGDGDLAAWLARFGHRAPDEADLATPRWHETPEAVQVMTERLRGEEDPLARHRRRHAEALACRRGLRARLGRAESARLGQLLQTLHRYLRWREDAKHELLRGTAILRQTALDAGRRLGIDEDVFMLTLPEVREALSAGRAPRALAGERRLQRRAEAELSLPRFLDRAALARAAAPPQVTTDDPARLPAFPLAAGVGKGPVRRVDSPAQAGDLGQGYVLVCRSTDPSWTPLLAGAQALIVERGGTLSHGAIVAREMGVPAVMLEDALDRLVEGEEVTVDGRGAVLRRGEEPRSPRAGSRAAGTPAGGPMRMADLEPPPLGRREARAGRMIVLGLALWGPFLAACWTLPASWLLEPCHVLCDRLCWGLVRALGPAGATAALAAGLAALTILAQRFFTDNERLRAVKERAAWARQQAAEHEPGSYDRRRLDRWARAAGGRLLLAALTPLALGLGPMILLFTWLPARLDPASWNAEPGTPIDIVATVASRHRGPVSLWHDSGLELDDLAPQHQEVPALRETLAQLRDAWVAAGTTAPPPELTVPALRGETATLPELQAFLRRPLPPQPISWRLHPRETTGGRHHVSITAGNETLRLELTQGLASPPSPRRVEGQGDPLLAVRATYAPPTSRRVFWQPLAAVGLAWDAGWLWVYLLAYLPAMFLCRWLLRVA